MEIKMEENQGIVRVKEIRAQQITYSRWWLGATLAIVVFSAYLMRVNISILIADPGFLRDMGLVDKPAFQGAIMSVFLLAYGIGNVTLGSMGDRFGPRTTALVAVTLWVVAMALSGIAKVYAMLLVAQVVLGVGQGMHFPTLSVYIKNWFPLQERALANAIWDLGVILGPALGIPFFAGMITFINWRSIFFLLIGWGLLLLPFIHLMGIDHPSLCRRTGFMELQYIKEGQQTERQMQTAAKDPRERMRWRELVGLKNIWVLVLAYCAVTSTGWGLMTWLPSYFTQARGFSWQVMGYLMALPFLAKGIGALMIGVISDRCRRFGRAPFYCLGLLMMSVFLFLGVAVPNNWWSIGLVMLANFFFAFTAPTAWALLQATVPGHLIGSGAGLMNGVANTVSSLSPMLIGAIIGATGSYFYGLMYLVGWGIIGVCCTAVLVLRRL